MSRIFVIGNEKGGAGKTTCAMHLISALLDYGYKVVSIDVDLRQLSLTSYIKNRESYNKQHPDHQVAVSEHFYFTNPEQKIETLQAAFEDRLTQARGEVDYVVIDTPGYCSELSKLAHSHADIIVTPINDSFLDLDVMAKVNANDLSIIAPSIYSAMVWEQKMQRAARDKQSIEWVVMRNRLSNIDAVNKRNVGIVLNNLAQRVGFKIAPGFSERVIFRELFLQGLTLSDLMKAKYTKTIAMSHIAARQELRDFLDCLNITPNLTHSKS